MKNRIRKIRNWHFIDIFSSFRTLFGLLSWKRFTDLFYEEAKNEIGVIYTCPRQGVIEKPYPLGGEYASGTEFAVQTDLDSYTFTTSSTQTIDQIASTLSVTTPSIDWIGIVDSIDTATKVYYYYYSTTENVTALNIITDQITVFEVDAQEGGLMVIGLTPDSETDEIYINWGDGTVDAVDNFDDNTYSHIYTEGEYTISVYGDVDKIVSLQTVDATINVDTIGFGSDYSDLTSLVEFGVNSESSAIAPADASTMLNLTTLYYLNGTSLTSSPSVGLLADIQAVSLIGNAITDTDDVIDLIYTNKASFTYADVKTIDISGGTNVAPTGTKQAPSGYIQANATTVGDDGSPANAAEMIYVLENQNIDNTLTKKYNWVITTN